MADRARRDPRPRNLATLRHLGSGKYSDVFKVTPCGGGKPVVMKVSYYRNDTLKGVARKAQNGDVRGAFRVKNRDSIRVSSAFARLTAKLIDAVSPHFVMVYCDSDCTDFAPRLGTLLESRLKELTRVQRRYNHVCFMEVFHTNMTKFLTAESYDEDALRGMIFQVVYTLAALQKIFPGFRHNDLSTNNVLVKRLRRRPVLAYTFGSKTYHVAIPILVALSDYDFTHVPGDPELSNERVMSRKYKVDGRRNDSYDTHFFLKSVLKCIKKRLHEFPQTVAWLKRLRLKVEDRQNGRFLARLRPSTLLEDPYFSPLERPPGEVQARYSA